MTPTTLTAEDRRLAQALVEQVTPGPWSVFCAEEISILGSNDEPVVDSLCREDDEEYVFRECDAAFIAASRDLVPRLLATVEQMEREQDMVNTELQAVSERRDQLAAAFGLMDSSHRKLEQSLREMAEWLREHLFSCGCSGPCVCGPVVSYDDALAELRRRFPEVLK